MAEPLKIASPKRLLKLDLACGQSPREGYEGVDLTAPGVQHVDLMKFPWPWEDSSVEALHCSHYIEHIPCREVEVRDVVDFEARRLDLVAEWVGRDMLFAFFDECHRVLVPGGTMSIICPSARSNRGFQDPTHRRFIVAETFMYLSAGWRQMNKLDHYRVKCSFDIDVKPGVSLPLSVRSAEYQTYAFETQWNAVLDWHATLKAVK